MMDLRHPTLIDGRRTAERGLERIDEFLRDNGFLTSLGMSQADKIVAERERAGDILEAHEIQLADIGSTF